MEAFADDRGRQREVACGAAARKPAALLDGGKAVCETGWAHVASQRGTAGMVLGTGNYATAANGGGAAFAQGATESVGTMRECGGERAESNGNGCNRYVQLWTVHRGRD